MSKNSEEEFDNINKHAINYRGNVRWEGEKNWEKSNVRNWFLKWKNSSTGF